MVLCSILIHGLSIPFFSLGRRVTTVTRTWSRQPSLPEWALHTHRVERAEDVVINRDPVSIMERGETGDAAKDGLSGRRLEMVVPEEDEKGDRGVPKRDTDSADADVLTVAVAEPEEAKADNAPDGTEVYGEWKEGPHRIIERRTGPGEEVRICLCVRRHANDGWCARSRSRSSVTHMVQAKPNVSPVHFAVVMSPSTMPQTLSSVKWCGTYHMTSKLISKARLACLVATTLANCFNNLLTYMGRRPWHMRPTWYRSCRTRPRSQTLRLFPKMKRMGGCLIRVRQRVPR